MGTDEELSRVITDSINRKHNSDDGLLSKCTYCENVNSIPPTFEGGKAKCQACGQVLQNPSRKVEIEGYNHIRRGMFALILFSLIVIAPSVYDFFEMTLVEDDSEETEGDAAIEYSSEFCNPESNKYDKEECDREEKLDRIIATGIVILIYSIPIYGLFEIAIGVSKLSKFNTTKF